MRRLDDKVSNAAHVKRHTRGTSNEISFSVLDAAKNAQDGDSRDSSSRPRFPGLGIIPLFTLGRKKPVSTPRKERGLTLSTGEFISTDDSSTRPSSGSPAQGIGTPNVESAPTLAGRASQSDSRDLRPMDEVMRRKKARMKGRLALAAVGVLAAVVIVVAGAGALAHNHQMELAKKADLGSLISRIGDAGVTFDSFIALVQDVSCDPSEVDVSDAERRRQGMDQDLADVATELASVKEGVEALQPKLDNPKDLDMSSTALEAIAVKNDVLLAGQQLIDTQIAAGKAYSACKSGWASVLEGDAAARDAAALASNTTKENVSLSIEKSQAAIAAFESAREDLLSVEFLSGCDMGSYVAYIDKRIEAQRHAIASDNAYLNRDKETAAAENDLYNQLDAEAVALVKALPDDVWEFVSASFDSRYEEAKTLFDAGIARMESADAILVDYLGRISK